MEQAFYRLKMLRPYVFAAVNRMEENSLFLEEKIFMWKHQC